MTDTDMIQKKKTAWQLATLAELFEKGQVSEVVTRSVDKMLAYEVEQCQAQIAQLTQDLAEYEQRFALSSAEFYQQYQAGQQDDRMDYRMDYVEWAALFQMFTNLNERLQLLTGGDGV